MNSIFDIINIPFGYFMRFCYSITGNYAIALLLFALAVKIIFIPFGKFKELEELNILKD